MMRLARLMATRHTEPGFCSGSLNLSQMMLLRALESHDALKMSRRRAAAGGQAAGGFGDRRWAREAAATWSA